MLAVDLPADVGTAVEAAGYQVVALPAVGQAPVSGAAAAVAAVLGGAVREVGLGELGVPVLVVVEADDEAAIDDALRRGAHDVLRRPLAPAEVAARLRAAERLASVQRALREAARTDLLTGLATRRHLDEHLEMVASMARRLRTSFSVLMVDVDRTARINDSHGHTAGDVVVAEVARRLSDGLRSEDVAGRWGGDEFLVILPHTPVDGAWRLADRIRASMCDEPVALGASSGDDVVVTVSVGCAEGYGDDVEDQLRRAAAALEEAKTSGRNRVIAAPPSL